MRRRIAAVAFGLLVSLTLAASAVMAAPITQDQAQTSTTDGGAWFNNADLQAQTFKASMSGTLAAVSLYIGVDDTSPALVKPALAPDLGVQIFATTGGKPSGAALATQAVGITNIVDWNEVAFDTPPAVVANTTYAIVLTPGTVSNHLTWSGVCASDTYTRGQALMFHVGGQEGWITPAAWATTYQGSSAVCQKDFAFKTFLLGSITPPPTSTGSTAPAPADGNTAPLLLLAGLAAAGAFVTARRVATIKR
jgi:hypothetical protein